METRDCVEMGLDLGHWTGGSLMAWYVALASDDHGHDHDCVHVDDHESANAHANVDVDGHRSLIVIMRLT